MCCGSSKNIKCLRVSWKMFSCPRNGMKDSGPSLLLIVLEGHSADIGNLVENS